MEIQTLTDRMSWLVCLVALVTCICGLFRVGATCFEPANDQPWALAVDHTSAAGLDATLHYLQGFCESCRLSSKNEGESARSKLWGQLAEIGCFVRLPRSNSTFPVKRYSSSYCIAQRLANGKLKQAFKDLKNGEAIRYPDALSDYFFRAAQRVLSLSTEAARELGQPKICFQLPNGAESPIKADHKEPSRATLGRRLLGRQLNGGLNDDWALEDIEMGQSATLSPALIRRPREQYMDHQRFLDAEVDSCAVKISGTDDGLLLVKLSSPERLNRSAGRGVRQAVEAKFLIQPDSGMALAFLPHTLRVTPGSSLPLSSSLSVRPDNRRAWLSKLNALLPSIDSETLHRYLCVALAIKVLAVVTLMLIYFK